MAQEIILPSNKLKRVLSFWDLVVYGIILIQPVAALPLFGHADHLSQGHAVTAILAAMLAMVLTAISYGRMANRYPRAGSAYTYVSQGLHPYLGFVTGWSMFMDYILVPIICVIYTGIAAHHLLPLVPYPVWVAFFIVGFTLLNLKGIRVATRANWIMMVIMSVVVFYFMGAAIRYVWSSRGAGALLSMQPFYDAKNFSLPALGSATALAALTYIGFDGITTLSEEVKNPRRNVLLAAVITCLITGIWSGAQIYLAQLSWPDWGSFSRGIPDEAARNSALDTAILSVANRVGGLVLDSTLSLILLLASVGSGITGQIGASRLLYGMGRDGVIPQKIFGHLDRKNSIPSYNILIIGSLALLGAFLLNYEESARLINFGAFFAFMGVNLSVIREYYFKSGDRSVNSVLRNLLAPLSGFVICFIIWMNLPLKTFLIGGSWMLLGIVYLAFRSKGFRKETGSMDFTE